MTSPSKKQSGEQSGSGFAGTLRNIQLTDIIQMCCLAGASICVRVRQDEQEGTLYVKDGDVVHAECGSITGVQAFFTILGWSSGQFETLDLALNVAPTIKEPCQFLLMEAARRADERAHLRAEEEAALELLPAERIRVMIVDDSPVMTKIITSMMQADPGIDVVATAKNGEEALAKMKELSPDLITMDVNMPVMGGSTALKHIMIESPSPVVIMSNLGPSSYATILSFLNLGAVDFMSKPVKNSNIIKQQQRMVDRIHLAVKANIKRFQRLRLPKLMPEDFVKVNETTACQRLLIAISGVGGYLEMVNMAVSLPMETRTCVVSLQSIPPQFTSPLSDYLRARSRFDAQPLPDNAILCPGRCYVGASGRAMEIDTIRAVWRLKNSTMEMREESGGDNLDYFLTSAAERYRDKAIVMLLSGGELGTLEGLRQIKAAGGHILAPQLDKAILPATIQAAADDELITQFFDPKDMEKILKQYCG